MLFIPSATWLSIPLALAQTGIEGDSVDIEGLYDDLEEEVNSKDKKTTISRSFDPPKALDKLSELSKLAPFQDVAIISKKFLPKSQRFELHAGSLLVLNNAFFNNVAFALKGGFYISEKWGVEGQYYSVYSSKRQITKDLANLRKISTRSLVVPHSFIGGSIKWVPIYGKMSLFEGRIVPFDAFFSLGYGSTEIQNRQGVGTIQLGVGQSFALGKSMALRWDLTWNRYIAEVESRRSGGREAVNHSDLFCGIGVSFFIPGVEYR